MRDARVEPDYAEIAKRLREGLIVPFFGAGASVGQGLPSAKVLAARLFDLCKFPDAKRRHDLALVASYLVQKPDMDTLTLRTELRTALSVPAEPGRLHKCLANIDGLRLFVTTNYDDLIEQALERRGPWVVVDKGASGIVWCRSPDGEWEEVESRNLSSKIRAKNRPIVLKMHGHWDRRDRDYDTYLITEEHYVDFLGRPDGQIPPMLFNLMREKSFLYLGYGLKDWNIRVLLRKLAQSRGRTERIRSWAIVLEKDRAEYALWKQQNVQMHALDLEVFVDRLEVALKAAAP